MKKHFKKACSVLAVTSALALAVGSAYAQDDSAASANTPDQQVQSDQASMALAIAAARQNVAAQEAQAGVTPASAAPAADPSTPAAPPAPPPPPKAVYGTIEVELGSGKMIKLPAVAANIFAADPAIVSVRPASATRLFIFGKGVGKTTLLATDAQGQTIAQYTIMVEASSYTADRLGAQSQALEPGSDVTTETEAGGVVLRGTVNSPEDANTIMNQASLISPGGKVFNEMQVKEPIQVELRVRIASMSRSTTRELGINWGSVGSSAISIGKFALTGISSASSVPSLSGTSPGSIGVTFPGGTFEGIIDALAADNLAHVLAEPTLTTLSGTQASFQVGGQFPVPISSSQGQISVTYENYGVLLTFTPTVYSDGRIALVVSPQLSTISSANSATISSAGSNTSIVIPSLNVTQATTTVILGSGQGMAIAGLLEDSTSQTDNGVPGLSETPIVGALFRGDAFQRQQQELVITVTPYLVNPVNNPGVLAQPDDGWTPPNDLQRILLLHDNGTTTAASAIPGDAGFMVQ
jgi:pilus assembly protein CpaC